MPEETGQLQTIESQLPDGKRATGAQTRGLGAPVKFDHNIDIFPDSRISEYDAGEVKAYRAVGRDKTNYFAMVCERHLVPRTRAMANYAAITNPFLVPLAAAGVIDWPPAKQQRQVFIFKDILGRRLLQGNLQALNWRQDEVMNVVV